MKNCMAKGSLLFVVLSIVISTTVLMAQQDPHQKQISYHGSTYPLYPQTLNVKPDIPSPLTTKDGKEILLVRTKAEKFALMPVTVENGNPLHYSKRVSTRYGKDHQLQINSGDFPSLIKTGLHFESDLDRKDMITGIPVSVITYIGRPGRFSGTGFMAEDEDIISVLKGDNHLVKKLSLTHPKMARPLFHVWNIILKEIELDRLRRFSNIQDFLYNREKVTLEAEGMKGWQISIFQDEIQGRFDIKVLREFTPKESLYLKQKYSHLSARQWAELEEKLSSISFSEMAPYYIMRYGFYEGHTDYRSDPIAIAFIFGLKSIEEIDNAFGGNLYEAMTKHFIK